jgi:hypothetical protein
VGGAPCHRGVRTVFGRCSLVVVVTPPVPAAALISVRASFNCSIAAPQPCAAPHRDHHDSEPCFVHGAESGRSPLNCVAAVAAGGPASLCVCLVFLFRMELGDRLDPSHSSFPPPAPLYPNLVPRSRAHKHKGQGVGSTGKQIWGIY